MKVEFVPINFKDLKDCQILANWFNDPNLNYLISPNFEPGPLVEVTATYISQINSYPKFEKYAYFIVCDQKIIGDVNITDNPDYLLKKGYNSSWLGISIGYDEYQNKGIGKLAMNFIEGLAIDLGFQRMELGVFSFNERAINFYKKLGYTSIGTVPDFTYLNGIWYDDLRFEKFF